MKSNYGFIPDGYDKPKFFNDVTYSYLTMIGSRAYGTSTPQSDYDFYGFIVPPLNVLFPHLDGHIAGFGRTYTPFEQYQMQHVQHPDYGEIDLTIYNIVKYFHLVMMGNPNMVDSLFTDEDEIMHCDSIGQLVKNNRHLFLSELCYHRYTGMAFSHANKLKSGKTKEGRKDLENEFGYDTKDAYHTMRILLEVQEILLTGNLNLKANAEYLKAVRQGHFTLEYILSEFEKLVLDLENIVKRGDSVVPYAPNEKSIKHLLIRCIEMSDNSLDTIGFPLHL